MARDRASRPEARPLRLFVALDVPEEVKEGLQRALAPFRKRIAGAGWTSPEGWHVTLKFLGATWPRLVDDVRGAVAEAASGAEPMETALTHVGVFPGPRRVRVVWVGLHDPEEGMARLARRLDDLLASWFRPEKRGFTPHLTVARLRTPRDVEAEAPGLVGLDVASSPFVVDRLVLYRSHLSPRGARYEPVLEAPLGAGR